MKDVGERLANRVQMTTDGHKPYLDAVEDVFGAAIACAMLVKVYGTPEGTGRPLSAPASASAPRCVASNGARSRPHQHQCHRDSRSALPRTLRAPVCWQVPGARSEGREGREGRIAGAGGYRRGAAGPADRSAQSADNVEGCDQRQRSEDN